MAKIQSLDYSALRSDDDAALSREQPQESPN